MLARAATLLAPAVLLPACLTQNIQFEPPRNYPPSIESAPTARHPLNQIIDLSELTPTTDGGAGGTTVDLEVVVRDPNVAQDLEYRVFIDFESGVGGPSTTPDAFGRIEPSSVGDGVARTLLPIQLQRSSFVNTEGCHRIELFVSTFEGFEDPLRPREPRVAGDLGTAVWWVVRDSTVDFSGCPE